MGQGAMSRNTWDRFRIDQTQSLPNSVATATLPAPCRDVSIYLAHRRLSTACDGNRHSSVLYLLKNNARRRAFLDLTKLSNAAGFLDDTGRVVPSPGQAAKSIPTCSLRWTNRHKPSRRSCHTFLRPPSERLSLGTDERY